MFPAVILLIGAEGTKTPAGVQGQGRPRRSERRGGSRTARGKRSAWSGNQQLRVTQPFHKIMKKTVQQFTLIRYKKTLGIYAREFILFLTTSFNIMCSD